MRSCPYCIYSLLCLLVIFCPNSSRGQGFAWAQSLGGGTTQASLGPLAFDSNNNILGGASFSGTVDFDQGAGTYNLSAVGNFDMVLLKEDASGNFIWAKHFPALGNSGNTFLIPREIASDTAGNIYITGALRDSFDLDPGPAVYKMASIGNFSNQVENIFVLKLDSSGNFIWAKQIAGTALNSAGGQGIKLDHSGNIYLVSNFSGTIDADPGAGIVTFTATPGVLIHKLDNAGNLIWVKMVGTGPAWSFDVDSSFNLYFAGRFSGTVDFDPGTGLFNMTTAGGDDVFVEKLDSAGNFQWAKRIGSTSADYAWGVAADKSGNVAVVGYYGPATVDFDPGPGVFNISATSRDMFTLRLHSNGDFSWATSAHPVGVDEARDVGMDSLGSVYTTGLFTGPADFDPGPAVYNLSGGVYVQKLDSSGNFVWGVGFGGSLVGRVFLDNVQNVYVTGTFNGTGDFDPGPGVFTLTGNNSGFTEKLYQCGAPIVAISGSSVACSGTSATYTAITNVTGGTIQWKVNGNNIGTNSLTYTYTPTNGDQVQAIVTTPSTGGCYTATTAISNTITVSTTPVVTPVLTITGSNNICQGTGVTYVSTSNVAGGAIEWFVNGMSSANGNTMTYSPANGEIVSAVVTTPPGCYSAVTDTSNAITMVVNANITPTISIAASANNACTGTSVTYTATSNITGGSYQWMVNNNPVGSGGSGYTYTPVNNDVVTVVFTPPAGGCYTNATATSNAVTMTVMPMLTPTLSISTPFTAICAGTPTTFSATTNIGGGTMQWKVNGATVSNNVNSYTYSPQNNDIVTAVYTVPGTVCTGNPVVTSNAIPMSVAPMLTPSAVVNGPSSAVQGQPVTLTATLTNSGSSYYLTWKNKGVIMNTTTVPTITYIKGPGTDTITAQVIPLSAGCWDVPVTNAHIVTDVPTGITETMMAAGIEVYPNPFTNMITVKGLKPQDQLRLVDITGRVISSWRAAKDIESFKTEGLAAGHYVLKITAETGTVRVNVPVVKQ
jgi:hypothetical protein